MSIIKKLDQSVIIEDDTKSEKELVEYCLENGVSLNEANLEDLNLRALNFNNAFIINANFKNAYLSEISSKNATFIDCDFSGADLSFCNFLRTEFENCIFDGVNIRNCIGDMKNIFSIAIDTYVMSFTKTMMNLGCNTKTIEEWRNLTTDNLEDEEQKWMWDYYKDVIFKLIDKRLGVEK